tara:strand:- start:190 stop:396 length:207 start_codon:yes stop_codon:yes gene_type:complete
MHSIIKLIEEHKTFSNELQTEVLPVTVVKKIVEELYNDKFNLALDSLKGSVSDIQASIRKIADGELDD